MAEANTNQPIIIKKVKKGHHDSHHGGAWKVAYADFVTAMMAFFLLLWLLNATTEDQKRGIADYFSPASISKTTSGAGGILGGMSMSPVGARFGLQPQSGISISLPPVTQGSEAEEGDGEEIAMASPVAGEADMTEEEFEKRLQSMEDAQFAAAEHALRQAIQEIDELRPLAESLLIDRTPEGLRIQLVDQEGLSMFPSGSAGMFDHTKTMLGLVSEVVMNQPNQIAIYGHTDAVPYASESGYSNWELSSDRANASRRMLLDSGLPPRRIARVVGKAETDPLLKDDPTNARNRRISIVILSDTTLYRGAAAQALEPLAGAPPN